MGFGWKGLRPDATACISRLGGHDNVQCSTVLETWPDNEDLMNLHDIAVAGGCGGEVVWM